MGGASRKNPNSFVRATRALQENASRSGPVAGASYSLIGAILLLGGGGYLLDGKLGTKPWLAVGGLLLGIVVGFYELIKVTRPQ
jgi:F0F1-type ATP synthase assembly protein I